MSQSSDLTKPLPTKKKVVVQKNVPLSHRLYFHLIIFFILFILSLIFFTWFLYNLHRDTICRTDINYWCFDDWYCQKPCTKQEIADKSLNSCFGKKLNDGVKGLASCLYGPDSLLATVCSGAASSTNGGNTGPPDPDNLPTAASCDCPGSIKKDNGSAAANNSCLNYCPMDLKDLSQLTSTQAGNAPAGFCGCSYQNSICGVLPDA